MAARYWLVLHPDISRPIGGVKQMHRLAEAIASTGRQATIIQDDQAFHPSWFASTVQTIAYKNWLVLRDSGSLNSRDVLIFPETYISSVNEYSCGLACVIFNQNASYTFGLPGLTKYSNASSLLSLYRQENIKQVFCVSEYDFQFLSDFVCDSTYDVSLIVNGLEDSIFSPISRKKKRIVYMPRKNSLDAHVVRSLIKDSPDLYDWSVLSINGLLHHEVVSLLNTSLLFLSFGHPEGFGLPVAEALASGCAVVGYSGLGGRELFSLASSYNVAREINVGDWGGFISAIKSFDKYLTSNPKAFLNRLYYVSRLIQAKYSFSSMKASVQLALEKVESRLN